MHAANVLDRYGIMQRKTSKSPQEEIINLLGDAVNEPEQFNALIGMWNTFFELGSLRGEQSFSDVEAAAITSVAEMSDITPHASVGRQVGEMLEKFESPAYLVSEDGQIKAQNSAAFMAYHLGADATLDDLPLALEMDTPINTVLRASLKPGRNSYDAVLKRAFSSDDDRPLTLSITPSKPMIDGQGEALVFVVDARWKTAAAGLIKREFDLTDAERELLEAFLDGQSTQDMATHRNRSHATIRTQFHSLMSKMGARSQTELFRNALSVSQFVDKISAIAEVLRHPYRKRADILRPGGRSVEVTMAGDLTGAPIVFLQNPLNYRLGSVNEQILHRAGLCMLSICRPGYGDTDPAAKGDCPIQTAADDIATVLDQLGHQKTVLMTTTNTAVYMYALAPKLADRLYGLVPCSAFLPPAYFDEATCISSWTKGLSRALKQHPSMAKFFIKVGVPAWAKMGAKMFFTAQFQYDKDTLAPFLQPEFLAEAQHALETATRQGRAAVAAEITASFSDFSADIDATDLPILIIHGDKDEVFPIKGVRMFAQRNASRVRLLELADVGNLALDNCGVEIFDAIKLLFTDNTA